jgi:DNA-binding CsgD family transcriptional regulator
MSVLLEHFEHLQACKSPELLASEIARSARALGFEHWMYALDLPVIDQHKRQFILGGYPDAWVSHYFADDYLRLDPVIAHCQTHATPLIWPSADRQPREPDHQSAQVKRMFGEAAEFGLRSGVSIPLHGLGCTWGLVSFSSETTMSRSDLEALAPKLHWFAHCIHEAGHGYARDPAPGPLPHLTSREIECLHWVAVGKTGWEIGRLLGVAERTVVFHLQNATHKLGVHGRKAAIARAIMLGLINP